jgi:hypothetical protein
MKIEKRKSRKCEMVVGFQTCDTRGETHMLMHLTLL